MAKVVNITDKLNFNENPIMNICGVEVEVNSDAETMIRIMGLFSEKGELQAVMDALNLIFSPEDLKKICNLKQNGKKLSGKSLMVIVQEAINLVMGEDEGE